MDQRVGDHLTSPVLVGVNWTRTQRALLLAVGFFTVVGTLRHLVIRNLQGSPYYLLSALLEGFKFESQIAPFAMGWITILGLAANHAYLNEGYLPSLVLATGPVYGYYVFNGPGAAPVWAAQYVSLEVVTIGTGGFLLGLTLRRLRERENSITTLRNEGV